jgi:hypothetical protein
MISIGDFVTAAAMPASEPTPPTPDMVSDEPLIGPVGTGLSRDRPGAHSGERAEPPSLSVVLEPHSNGGTVDYVDVSMAIEHPNVAAGATLLRMPLVVVSIPTARYDGDAIQARDASGTLPLTQKDAPPTS